MLVYYYGHVNGSLEQVSNAISSSEGAVSAWARLAYRKGEELRTRIDPGPSMPTKEVEIILGSPVGRSGSVLIPIAWKATGAGAVFPVMSADLVLQPVGPGLVQVVFRGSYEPPMGGFGRLLDRTVMHRLAEASAKSFLDQLCGAINEALTSDRQYDTDGGTAAHTAVEGGVAPRLLSPASQTG